MYHIMSENYFPKTKTQKSIFSWWCLTTYISPQLAQNTAAAAGILGVPHSLTLTPSASYWTLMITLAYNKFIVYYFLDYFRQYRCVE